MKVMICENDAQGSRSGKVFQIDFHDGDGDIMLSVAPRCIEGEKINTYPGSFMQLCAIEIYGRKFKGHQSAEWVGNIMWNAYDIFDRHALALINTLHESRDWTVCEAYTEIYNAWQKVDEIPGELFGITD